MPPYCPQERTPLQQVVDSWIAGLITEEAFEWLLERQTLADQLLLEGTDLGSGTEYTV